MACLGTVGMNTQVHISHACPIPPEWPTNHGIESLGEGVVSYGVSRDPLVESQRWEKVSKLGDFTKWDISSEKQNLRKPSTVGSSHPVTPSTKGKKQQQSECSPVSLQHPCSSLRSTHPCQCLTGKNILKPASRISLQPS